MEMLTFALVMATRQFRPYFQAHPIMVLTETPLKKVLQKLDASRCLVSWSIELSEFNIDYLPRHAIKGQALANFVAEFTNFPRRY